MVFFMKKMKYILIAILVLPATLLAQSTEEVAERYLNAIGGKEAIVAFSESKMVGSMSMMGMNIPVTMYVKSPGKVRVESQVMGQSIIQATNGETAWMINPMMGSTAPQKVSASEVSDAGIGDDVFLHMGEEGYSFEYKGESTIDGADYYHIYIEAPSGKQDHYYSKDTGLRVMVESKVTALVTVAVPSKTSASLIDIAVESSELIVVPANLIPDATTPPVPFGNRIISSFDLADTILLPSTSRSPPN